MKKTRILFLCTGNSCRSQMAEGWARALKGEALDVASAGIVRHGLNPRAVQAMAEAGVDISWQTSKTIDDLPSLDFDWIITLCGHANESCPMVFGPAKRLHVGFDDPPALAAKSEKDAVTEAEAMAPYRRVRDEIRAFVEGLPASLDGPQAD
ncbi:arsenate reductase ArsC [Megalodesulfovibrio paquesii]